MPNAYVDLDSLRRLDSQLERKIGYVASTIRRQSQAYTWRDVRSRLKPGEAAVEIIRYNQWQFAGNARETDTIRYAALILRPGWPAPRRVLLPPGSIMETDWLLHYQQTLESGEQSTIAYQRFWQPMAGLLQGASKVFFAADGVYHLLSLPTLFDGRRYLADALQLVLVNSTRDLMVPPSPSKSTTGVLLGFPAYYTQRSQLRPTRRYPNVTRGGISFESLPATKTEVEQVGRLLAAFRIKPKLLLGEKASEPAIKAVNSPRIVHIATHGFFIADTANPFYRLNRLLACGLVLAGAADTTNRLLTDEDGILTGYEATLLKLADTELVTLSACETGNGDAQAGEGVFGLQRAFRLAGARAVLMSLWKVDDTITQRLMTDFYRYWLAGDSKPQALRRAQAKLRRHHPYPYHWGAFVLLGQ